MKEMKLLQCSKVSTYKMKELEDDGIEKKKEKLNERNTTNIVIKKAKEEIIKKLLKEGTW